MTADEMVKCANVHCGRYRLPQELRLGRCYRCAWHIRKHKKEWIPKITLRQASEDVVKTARLLGGHYVVPKHVFDVLLTLLDQEEVS